LPKVRRCAVSPPNPQSSVASHTCSGAVSWRGGGECRVREGDHSGAAVCHLCFFCSRWFLPECPMPYAHRHHTPRVMAVPGGLTTLARPGTGVCESAGRQAGAGAGARGLSLAHLTPGDDFQPIPDPTHIDGTPCPFPPLSTTHGRGHPSQELSKSLLRVDGLTATRCVVAPNTQIGCTSTWSHGSRSASGTVQRRGIACAYTLLCRVVGYWPQLAGRR
jgi:hypothetical protein